jgi:ATP-dependent protease HslVU (ClpYQ) peptidase subunit
LVLEGQKTVTVGICIKCSDGIVLACDSLTTFGRGVPVLKHSNKVHVLKHDALQFPVAVEAAGVTTFFDKFRDRVLRNSLDQASAGLKRKLDIVDFCESVCEPTVLSMFKEYVFDRAKIP